MRLNLLSFLLLTSLVFYIILDLVSTVLAYYYLGTFQYEGSAIMRMSFDLAGIPGFIVVKTGLALVALLLAYWLGSSNGWYGLSAGLLLGASLAGLFVSISNLDILVNNTSIWILGLNSGTIGALIVFGSVIYGTIMIKPKAVKPNVRENLL